MFSARPSSRVSSRLIWSLRVGRFRPLRVEFVVMGGSFPVGDVRLSPFVRDPTRSLFLSAASPAHAYPRQCLGLAANGQGGWEEGRSAGSGDQVKAYCSSPAPISCSGPAEATRPRPAM